MDRLVELVGGGSVIIGATLLVSCCIPIVWQARKLQEEVYNFHPAPLAGDRATGGEIQSNSALAPK